MSWKTVASITPNDKGDELEAPDAITERAQTTINDMRRRRTDSHPLRRMRVPRTRAWIIQRLA